MSNLNKFIISTDGAARGNPGPAAAAFVIQTPDGVIWAQEGVCLGKATNNKAEYTAVKNALEKLIKDFAQDLPTTVELRSDSQLLVNQLSGNFKVKNEDLKILFYEVKDLEKQVGEVRYLYIPRANNTLADKLANMALDSLL